MTKAELKDRLDMLIADHEAMQRKTVRDVPVSDPNAKLALELLVQSQAQSLSHLFGLLLDNLD